VNGFLTETGNATTTSSNVKSQNTGYNPKVNLAYTPTDDLTVYGTVAKGFRPGGVNQPVPVSGPLSCLPGLLERGLDQVPDSYGPDTVWNYELAQRLWGAVKLALEEGARTRDIGGRLSTTQMGDAVLKGV
jgi:iron complex outermembrane recepter protein